MFTVLVDGLNFGAHIIYYYYFLMNMWCLVQFPGLSQVQCQYQFHCGPDWNRCRVSGTRIRADSYIWSMHTALFNKQKINNDGISSCLLTNSLGCKVENSQAISINNSSLVCQGRSEATSQQSARKGWCGGRRSTTCVWNLPIDVEYRSTNAFGWPRIIITVLEIRAENRNRIIIIIVVFRSN